jgi:Ca2+-binding RTX toxin-like protein
MPPAPSHDRRIRHVVAFALALSALVVAVPTSARAALPANASGVEPLAPRAPKYTLDVIPSGDGSVASSLEGIDCPSDCSATYDDGTTVSLTASPAAGWGFSSWSGAGCSGGGDCTVTMEADEDVTATFLLLDQTLTVAMSGSGDGHVSSSPSGIDCGSDCSESYLFGTTVTLTAEADADSSFAGWSGGGCSGTEACVVTMDEDVSVTALFEPQLRTLSVNKNGPGAGSVTSDPAGITCGGDCSHKYEIGTEVTLTATPNATSAFSGWEGGGCSGSSRCTLTLDGSTTVRATFVISDACTMVGTTASDVLRGTSLNDVICGLGGNDLIWGGGGADSLVGGPGNDVLIGGPGNDALDGRAGSDTAFYLKGAPGRKARTPVSVDLARRVATGTAVDRDRLVRVERVVGTDRADVLLGSRGDDALLGGAGNDRLKGRRGGDELVANGGDDIASGGLGDDVLRGGDGGDRLTGDRGDDRCDGGPQKDSAETCEVRISIP